MKLPSGAKFIAPPEVATAALRVRLPPPVVVILTSPPVVVTAPRGISTADVIYTGFASLVKIKLPPVTETPR